MTYEYILILTRYLAQWRRGHKHPVGVGVGAGAEIRGGYRWCSDSPSQPKLCHPLITQSCRQCSVGASTRFGRHAGKKKKKTHRHAEPWQPERRSSWKHWPCGCRDNPAQLTNILYGWETRCRCHGGSAAYLGWRLALESRLALSVVLTEQKAIVAPIVFTYSKKFSVSVGGDRK